MDHHDLLAKRINDLAEQRGWSVNKLATESGITQSTLAGMLNNAGRVPKADTLYQIAEGFNMSLTELLDFPPYNQRPDGSSAAKQRTMWEELGNALTPEEQERVRRILMGNDKGELK